MEKKEKEKKKTLDAVAPCGSARGFFQLFSPTLYPRFGLKKEAERFLQLKTPSNATNPPLPSQLALC